MRSYAERVKSQRERLVRSKTQVKRAPPRKTPRDDATDGPPDETLGMDSTWMLQQRSDIAVDNREITVQRRLQIPYRITPVFTPLPTLGSPPPFQYPHLPPIDQLSPP